MIPIHKPDKDLTDPGAYRPISLTSHLGKTLETIINRRLVNYLDKNDIISVKQADFRHHRESIEQVIDAAHCSD